MFYAAVSNGLAILESIFSMKMPYPVVGSLIITWVTAPTRRPSCTKGLPLRSAVNKGQHILTENSQNTPRHYCLGV